MIFTNDLDVFEIFEIYKYLDIFGDFEIYKFVDFYDFMKKIGVCMLSNVFGFFENDIYKT
jgi:hypothetical protein